MINLTGALIEQYTIALMLTSVRFMGLLLTAPMLSFRAFPISFRVMLSVLIGFLFVVIFNLKYVCIKNSVQKINFDVK